MKTIRQRSAAVTIILSFAVFAVVIFTSSGSFEQAAFAKTPTPTPTPTPAITEFDQKAALAKLREQIKGKEKELASTVFKNVQMLKDRPAGQLLAIMEFGYARSLGVNCTHCHVPEKWESEEKPQKQITRDMAAMMGKINTDMLKNIKNLFSESPIVNCTTCHRGEVKPALNLPQPPKS